MSGKCKHCGSDKDLVIQGEQFSVCKKCLKKQSETGVIPVGVPWLVHPDEQPRGGSGMNIKLTQEEMERILSALRVVLTRTNSQEGLKLYHKLKKIGDVKR